MLSPGEILAKRRIERSKLLMYMDIKNGIGDSPSHSSKKRRKIKFVVVGMLALSAIAAASLVLYFGIGYPTPKPAESSTKSQPAELISAEGIVLAGKPGLVGWRQVTVGARLMEGDLIQTDKSGEACIRYSNGTTVTIQESTIFTVQSSEDGSMEISVTAPDLNQTPVSPNPENEAIPQAATASKGGIEAGASKDAKSDESRLYIRLNQIVPFGRSLELIGKVEAGSRLLVNDEMVDVTGDGSFKHFTNPFPVSVQRADLVLKATDLAGQTRTATATYDFKKRTWDR